MGIKVLFSRTDPSPDVLDSFPFSANMSSSWAGGIACNGKSIVHYPYSLSACLWHSQQDCYLWWSVLWCRLPSTGSWTETPKLISHKLLNSYWMEMHFFVVLGWISTSDLERKGSICHYHFWAIQPISGIPLTVLIIFPCKTLRTGSQVWQNQFSFKQKP